MLDFMKQLFTILFLLTGSSVFADDVPPPPIQAAPAPQAVPDQPPPLVEDYGAAFFKMIVMLLGILVLVILTIWIIKRFGHGRVGRFRDKQSIHILEKRVLSPKSILYLIEVEGARLLVAESQLEMRPLHQWQASLDEEES